MVDYLTFGGVKSSDYDIYISGEGVFSAPKRDVEAVTIPGRDGDFMHDKGRYENITVTYPAFTHQGTYAQFISNIDNFRNAIASKTGYQTLTDTYHPSEYRMACLTEGMEIDPILYNSGAKFDLVFNCKPQRFLISGDTAVAVANNGTITNPTLFDAKPQLQVKGYGAIGINSEEIEIENIPLGRIELINSQTTVESKWTTSIIVAKAEANNMNAGDAIEVDSVRFRITADRIGSIYFRDGGFAGSPTNCTASLLKHSTHKYFFALNTDTASFTYGTSGTFTATANYRIVFSDNTDYTSLLTATITYNGAKTFTFTISDSESSSKYDTSARDIRTPYVYGDSTKTATGNPAYIDLDIGEAWNEDGDEPVSIDNAVILPAKLPVLSPGVNTITYDNTVTSFKIVPRWWKI